MKASKHSDKNNPFYNSNELKVLGIGKQDVIRYFFGGNATLAIIVISMIILFLVYHSYSFFPQYREKLDLYRKSGQEFTDYASEQLTAQKELSSLATQAREYEIQHQLGALYNVRPIHAEFKRDALKLISSERKEYEREKTRLNDLQDEQDTPAEQLDAAQQVYDTAKAKLQDAAVAAVNTLNYSTLSNKSWKTDPTYLEPIRASVVESIMTGKFSTDFVAETKEREKQAVALIDATPAITNLNEARSNFLAPQKDFDKFVSSLRKVASTNKSQAVTFTSAAARKEALEKKQTFAKSEEEQEMARIESARVLTIEPDYTSLNQPLYDSLPKHKDMLAVLSAKTAEGFARMPQASEFQSKLAQRRIRDIEQIEDNISDLFEEKRHQMETWDHNKPVSMMTAVTGFFMGTKWVTNSSWQDFYGILPLLAGSVCVAIVAVILAIPFAVGGAIYVNRLASPFEQKFIKPVIEFIGAIPSIVLAFFGVVVLGELLQTHSQSPILSWIPGFPVEGRLTILNAGILLAFMSIPTIFTLAEDALNNVPKAYKEASLALGATPLQTVLSVIIPSCSSGIIAAILLGFGRIIGETMVVLLVMGGRIAIPKSFTDPAHSMTGILAQEIGEVDEGSLHWGALFMVGLVLFVIALTLNYVAQTTLRKFAKR
ncbi:phosphate ABC transporter permease subunit PstC [Rubritalea marina]|uniref:phosphate ABC transporter permease subunit PstC n=1 Tax=Rubritalea marina TaxID=361055 RepID=UPI00037505D7|nr:phosphate ABC transporter permease subunit PstC [Rubritalea marina]